MPENTTAETGQGAQPAVEQQEQQEQQGVGFTQADVDRIVADRLARERAKYADYDDLKKAAKEADRLRGEYEEILGARDRAEHDLRIERVARKYFLDDDLVPFLSGETDEEVEERAKTLASKLAASTEAAKAPAGPRPDPSQGRGSDLPLNGDPLLDSLKSKLGIP